MLRATKALASVGIAGVSALGLLAAASPAMAATPYPTTLTDRAPAVVTYGAYEAVLGHLVLEGTPFGLSGEKVALYDRRAGTTTWTFISTHVTDAHGNVRFLVKPLRAMQFQLRHPRDSYTTASNGSVLTTKVAWRVLASLTKSSVAPKATDAIAVTVSPNAKGASVTLQRKGSSGWVSVTTKTLNSSSATSFTITAPSTAGKVYYRVAKAASSAYTASTSPVLVLNVT